MVRVLIWWTAAEASHVYRRCGSGDSDVWYFAYGSNVLDANLRKRRLRVRESRGFTLPDYRLIFQHPSPHQGVGFADVVPQPGSEVHGRLLRMSAADALWLHLDELVFPFSRYRIQWLTRDGIDFFFYRSNVPVSGLLPSERYLCDMIDGLHALGFSDEQLDDLREQPTATTNRRTSNSRYFVRDIERFPRIVRPAVEWYERVSLDLFRSIWSRSMFSNGIEPHIPRDAAAPEPD